MVGIVNIDQTTPSPKWQLGSSFWAIGECDVGTDGFSSMRSTIDEELVAIAHAVDANALTCCKEDIQMLMTPHPAQKREDRILENLGEDFFHDVHAFCDGSDDAAHSLRVSQMFAKGAS